MEKKFFKLTNPQNSIWLTEQYYKNTSIGNISGIIFINELIDLNKLKLSIKKFVDRNDSFHIKVLNIDGLPNQYFDDSINFDINILKFSSNKEADFWAKNFAKKPLKLIDSNLFEFIIFLLPNGFGGIITKIHHLISDAWTSGLLVNGIMDIYESLMKFNCYNENLSYSYKNYLKSEKEYLISNKFMKDKEFWNKTFSSIPSIAEIPSKNRFNKFNSISYKSSRKEYVLQIDFVSKINSFCKLNHVSLFNFFISIFSIYINRVCNLDDFVIGTPILNRTNFNEKNSTGMYISTIPFRVKIDNSMSFVDFIKTISMSFIQIYRHQKYPYQFLLNDLRKKDSNIPNLYDLLISYQNIKSDTNTNSINYNSKWKTNGNCSDSLNIHLYDMNDDGMLNIAYDYQNNKYTYNDIKSIHNRILSIISQVLQKDNLILKDISILSLDDKISLFDNFSFNNYKFNYSKNILQEIEKVSNSNLDYVAIESENDKITYKDLFIRVNKLSNYLLSKNLNSKNIGIFTYRNIDSIVGILAILKLGSTFVPIDPEYPTDRINYMINQSNIDYILSANVINDFMPLYSNLLIIDIRYDLYKNFNSTFSKNIEYNLDDNLYIVFTSGSTGNPKGIMLSHKNMLNLINFEKYKTNLFTKKNRILQFATMSFDVSYQEIFSALLTNSTLVLVKEETRKNMYNLSNYIFNKKIDTLFIPPAYLRLITESSSNIKKLKTHLKNIITAGEELVVTKGIKSLILSGINIHNHYGPAETHVATTYSIDKSNIELKPPIGFPISNVHIYILDSFNKISPFYTIGQIAIAGDCVGNGYINNKELTSQKFIFDVYSNTKLYLTGDLGYIDENNCLHYIGRSDFQVKINGFRIELEEIDKVLMKMNSIQHSFTKIFEKNNKKYIVSYYVSNKNISKQVIFDYLKSKLPIYMIPKKIIKLSEFPLNENGKIDKKSLPTVDLFENDDCFISPKTLDEIKFSKIWKEIFNVDKISTNYNFFSIGGDSLLAIKLSAKIMDFYKINISVKDIFTTPVFSDLLNLILMNTDKEINTIKNFDNMSSYPLSSAQKRIYYANNLIGDNNLVYNLPGGILIKSVLDVKKVEDSFNFLIKKHSSFRTYFKFVENEPRQFIEDSLKVTINIRYDSHKNIRKIINSFPSPFDLSKAPLLHVSMYILDNKETLILLDSHHIVMDGISLSIILQDFCDFYNGKNNNIISKISYTDYALWENKKMNENLKHIENFWLEKFKGNEISVLDLPYDFSRPIVKSYKGNKISRKINKILFDKYIDFSTNIGVSPYMFFMTAFLIVLYKYTNQNKILIGSPIAGREIEQLQNIVGMFTNNIVLYNIIDSEETVLSLINKVKNTTIDALTYQPYPYDKLVSNLNLEKDLSRNPLFDVMFIYQNIKMTNLNLGGSKIKLLSSKTNISKFDLSLEILPSSNTINIEYCTDLFKKITINNFLNHYLCALDNIYKFSNKKVKEISIINSTEKEEIFFNLTGKNTSYPVEKTISTLFEEQVDKTPNDIALTFNSSSLTYSELNSKSNSLAYYLRNLGISRNDVIGIMLPRSLELIISILSVLKSGATYIPIDPMYPKNRIDYMLTNSNAKYILTFKDLEKHFDFDKKIFVELSNSKIYDLPSINIFNINKPTDSCYIIYTSGSTGLPKGVVINHKSITNLTYHLNDYVDFLKNSSLTKNFLSVTTASFDIFFFETLISLQKGLKVILADEEAQRVPSKLNELIKFEDAQIIQLTPSRMQFLIDNKSEIPLLENLKYIILAGEPLPIKLLKILNKMNLVKVYNGYGPSETTIFSSFTDVTNYKKITIGKPINNTQMYILDKDLSLVPKGISGELYISGDCVGNGYLNNPSLTEKSFIPNPFIENSVLYKTGDSVKLLENGELDYIERLDNQIKIRGLRIELEEIENKILNYNGIKKVKVIKQVIKTREFISAYFVANTRIKISDLRIFLLNQLPNYMVPSYFIALDDFPYTPNGKIDRNSLPLPSLILSKSIKIENPHTSTQKKLVSIWENILNISPIGIRDNFFELGGDSILAMNLHIELIKFSNKISYSDIFSNPTIYQLANIIDENKSKSKSKKTYDLKQKYKLILNSSIKLPNEFNYSSPGNILLTGVTGFLGSHILDAFLKKEQGKIYCLIRNEPGLTPQIKLLDKLHYYFGNKYDNLINKRIFVIKSDITDVNLGLNIKTIENLSKSIDTVINSAAKVSHYGTYNNFHEINVKSVENIINFCMKYNKKFYQISTLSVSGNSFVDQYYEKQSFDKDVNFSENNFYIGQSLNNVYIKTKFEAEKLILDSIPKGLNAFIFRIGNLMPRFSDGKFQPNSNENAYLNRLLAFLEIGSIPNSLLDEYLEFTPVDFTSLAILKLISYSSSNNRIFHLFNDNHINVKDFLNILNIYNYYINIKSDYDFKQNIKDILTDNSRKHILNNIINDFDENLDFSYKTNIIIKSDFSKNYLNNLGFKWPKIDNNYVRNIISCIESMKKGDL